MQDVKQLSPSLAHLKKIVTTGRKQRACEETFAANLPCLKKREAVTLAGTPRACFASVLTSSSEQVVARRRFVVLVFLVFLLVVIAVMMMILIMVMIMMQ